MDLYRKVRLACSEGMSQRKAARQFGVSRDSVRKMLAFSVPPGYRRTAPVKRPKLDGFTEIIDGWLEGDREVHRKQRHTAKRVFERLRDEHGFTGGYTIIKDYMRERERRGREMFVPLAHPPGHAQADFGEAVVVIGGVEQKAHFFVMDLPHSEALRASKYLGRALWRRWSGYHRRSRVETKMHCVKLLGQRLMARDFDRQVAELQVRIAVLNGYTALGIPVTEPVG